jgi:hypothetical protein
MGKGVVSAKRIKEWRAALAEERRTVGRVPWWTMVKAILQGTVPRSVGQDRIRVCLQCPLYSPAMKLCKSEHPRFLGLGCGCYIPLSALTPNPYGNGCYGHSKVPGGVGWPRYRMRWWERVWSPVRFALRK